MTGRGGTSQTCDRMQSALDALNTGMTAYTYHLRTCVRCGDGQAAAIANAVGVLYADGHLAEAAAVQYAANHQVPTIAAGTRVEILAPPTGRQVITNASLYKGSSGIVISADTGGPADSWFVRLDRPTLPQWAGDEVSFRAGELRVVADSQAAATGATWTDGDGKTYPLDHVLISSSDVEWTCVGWLYPPPGADGEPVPLMSDLDDDEPWRDTLRNVIENDGPVTVGPAVRQ